MHWFVIKPNKPYNYCSFIPTVCRPNEKKNYIECSLCFVNICVMAETWDCTISIKHLLDDNRRNVNFMFGDSEL